MRSLLLLLLLAASACTSHCPEVADIGRALAERKGATEPHLSITIPLDLASQFLDEELAAVDPVALLPRPLGILAKLAGNLDVRASEGAFVALGDNRLGVHAKLAVRLGGKAVLYVSVVMRLRPTFARDAVVFRVHADDLRQVQPELGDKPERALGRALADTALGRLLDERELAELANSLIRFLGGKGFELIRDQLLADVGRVTTLRVGYPRIPVRDSQLRVLEQPAVLELGIRTSLPVHTGLGRAAPTPSGTRVSIALSAATMAELANWAMDRGHVVSRYNLDFEPDEDGPVAPRLDWTENDERPFTVHMFVDPPDCARVRVQTKFAAAARDGNVHVEVSDGVVTRVDGSWLVKLGVWLATIANPIAFTHDQVARFALAIGSHNRVIAVDDVQLHIDPSGPDRSVLQLSVR